MWQDPWNVSGHRRTPCEVPHADSLGPLTARFQPHSFRSWSPECAELELHSCPQQQDAGLLGGYAIFCLLGRQYTWRRCRWRFSICHWEVGQRERKGVQTYFLWCGSVHSHPDVYSETKLSKRGKCSTKWALLLHHLSLRKESFCL